MGDQFESVEGKAEKIEKDAASKREARLRAELLDIQYRILERRAFPVVIVIGGVDGAGKGETVNKLTEWMDPRHIAAHAMGDPSDEELMRPPMYRFWRRLPPRGKFGVFFGSWYTRPIVSHVLGHFGRKELDDAMAEVVRFETMLAREGAVVMKFWFHLSKKAQKKRLKELESDKKTRWRVTDEDWRRFEVYDEFRAVSARALETTSTADAPWTLVDGRDARGRTLAVGETILAALTERLARWEEAKKAQDAAKAAKAAQAASAGAGDAAAAKASNAEASSAAHTLAAEERAIEAASEGGAEPKTDGRRASGAKKVRAGTRAAAAPMEASAPAEQGGAKKGVKKGAAGAKGAETKAAKGADPKAAKGAKGARGADTKAAKPADGARPASDVPLLRKLDLNKRLEKSEYDEQLEKWQRKLALLTRDPRFAKLSPVLVFEGADAAGKGGTIRRVTQALDARFYEIIPIAAPSDEERAQPYLWRFWRHAPPDGRFVIFDRSWYGRVLVERVEGFAAEPDWRRAYDEIVDFEEQLVRAGCPISKFWLQISKDEQLRRFQERESTKWKQFKITPEDWRNREKWDAYEVAASEMIERTSTRSAPWTIVESEDKHWARIKVLRTLCDSIEDAM